MTDILQMMLLMLHCVISDVITMQLKDARFTIHFRSDVSSATPSKRKNGVVVVVLLHNR